MAAKKRWQARWIWLPEALDDNHCTLHARHVFRLASVPGGARLAVTASHIYRLYINGRPVGRGPDRADPRFPYFDEYPVAPLLRPGKNTIFALLHHTRAGRTTRAWALYDGPPGFLAQLSARGAVLAATGPAWKMRRAPGWQAHAETISPFLSFRQCVELRPAWSEEAAAAETTFAGGGWHAPRVFPFGAPLPEPLPRETPMLEAVERYPLYLGVSNPAFNAVETPDALLDLPATIRPAADGGRLTLDFGRPMGGFPELVFEAAGTGELDIYYGEGLNRLRADRLSFSAGRHRWQSLDWRGARYLELHPRALSGPLRLESVVFREMVYPFENRGDFRCADPTLTRAWRVCQATARAAVKDHPVDCLNREQALWTPDIYVHGQALAACFGDLRPLVKALRQVFRLLGPDGVAPIPGPAGLGYRATPETLPWGGLSLPLAPTLANAYRHTGDRQLLEFLPGLARIFDHLNRYRDQRGLLAREAPGRPDLNFFGGWNFFLKKGTPAAFNFEYIYTLGEAAFLAREAGDRARAGAWLGQARLMRAAARRAFLDRRRMLFRDGELDGAPVRAFSPTPNAWAGLAGALRPNETGAWAEALRTDPAVIEPICPFDATLLLEALFSLGLDLHARRLLDACWGAIVRAGEPTLPETWFPGDATSRRYASDSSRSHAFGAGPAYLCPRHILGARPLTPGWGKTLIQPRDLGLESASGRVPTPRGDIAVAWEKSDAAWALRVVLPAGIRARVVLPRLGLNRERLLVNGREAWRADWEKALSDQVFRRPASSLPRRAACLLARPGVHEITLESF